jgi:hypothetical protein
MPSPDIIAREPGRRIAKSMKPERRAKQKVDIAEIDDTPAPSQQSQKSGPSSGRETSRRVTQRLPQAAGAEAHMKSHAGGMMDKAVGKQMQKEAKQRASGRISAGAAPGKAAASSETAPTQKQTLQDKKPRRRKLRNTGVGDAQ